MNETTGMRGRVGLVTGAARGQGRSHAVRLAGGAESASGTNHVFSEGHLSAGGAFKAIALSEDTYRRTDDGWRISSRVISPHEPPEMEGFEA